LKQNIFFFFLILTHSSVVISQTTTVPFPFNSLSASDQAKLTNFHYGCNNLVEVVDDGSFGQHMAYSYVNYAGSKATDLLVPIQFK